MLRTLLRAVRQRSARPALDPVAAAHDAGAGDRATDWTALHESLAAAIKAVRPLYPAGFSGAAPPRWHDESQKVIAIRSWARRLQDTTPSFDTVACLRTFAADHANLASPLIVLAQEYRAAGLKALAVKSMAAALSINHYDLYTQREAAAINAWAEGGTDPNIETGRRLKQRFCNNPFEMLETTPNGDAYVCCPSWLPVPIGNVDRQTAGDIWNSPIAQELRRSILDGSFRYCSKMHCSRIANDWLPAIDSPEAARWTALPPETILDGPREVLLSHDQSCNLACPSCRKDFILANKEEQESLDRVMSEFVLPVLKQAQTVRITGSGDPFGSNHFRRVIKSINRTDFPQLWIDLHTNGQLWNQRAWTELGLSSLVRKAEISIDAARPETYEVVRRGGDLARLLENLQFVASLRSSGEVQELCLSFVVQALNFREMPAFVELGQRFGADLIQFNMIRNWGTYTSEEFQQHFIGGQTHPDHGEFLEVLRSPVLASANVAMGNVMGYAN